MWRYVVVVLLASEAALAQSTGPADVAQEGDQWILSCPQRRVVIDGKSLAITIEAGAAKWTIPAPGGVQLVALAGKDAVTRRLEEAKERAIAPTLPVGGMRGVSIKLGGFADLDLALELLVQLDAATGDLAFDARATEPRNAVRELFWPAPIDPASVDVTVVPFMQGMLLPRDWAKEVRLYEHLAYGRGLYMPWWGQQRGDASVITILETPADGGCNFSHPAGGPTRIGVKWVHSLGKLGYARQARMRFIDKGGYVAMAKAYRRYVVERGQFVSLQEKIARSPLVERLVGSPIIHTSILSHIQPGSSYFARTPPEQRHALVTFDARAEQMRKLHERGVKTAYVHLDGWGVRGYDNLHPDVLPPCPEAGGWDGMKRLADTLESLGYLFAVHDNYRDFYCDASSFNEALVARNEDGSHYRGHEWWGGEQSLLCSVLAREFVSRNHRALRSGGVKLRGSYLDVFSIVPGDECYNPAHPCSRADSLRYRGQCLDLIRSVEGIASSEEPTDWSIPHIDLCHHAPFALDPNPGGGPAFGIPVPLFSLVYHDAIFVPWSLSTGGWGIPDGDWGLLHALLNGGLPYLNVTPSDEELSEVQAICALARQVGLSEMLSHEFLDAGRRVQRSRFADGTTVTVDFAKRHYTIEPGL